MTIVAGVGASAADVNAALAAKANTFSPNFTGTSTHQIVNVTGALTGTSGAFSGAVSGATVAASGNATVGGTLAVTGATTQTGDINLTGRLAASSGSLRFLNNGANGWNFQNAAGGSALLVNGNASSLANQVTILGQVAGNGPQIIATGSDTNIDLKLSSKGTGHVTVLSSYNQIPGTLNYTGGVAPTSNFALTTSATGSITTASAVPTISFSLNSDTVSKAASSGFQPFVGIIKNWGGGSQQGAQQAFRVNMVQTGAVTGYTPPQDMQMGATGIFADYSFNLGGTSTVEGSMIGAAYSLIPAVWLHPGATNYQIVSNAEWDMQLDATRQDLTLGGTITAGDTITLTYTSTSIVGSPVNVVATAGTGDALQSLVYKLVSAVNNNAALANAGVSAQPDTVAAGVVNLFWQTQNTTTVAVAVGGSATETAGLGAVVPGASAGARVNMNWTSRGAGRGANKDTILDFGTLQATTGGAALSLFNLGARGGVFPIAPGGSLLTTVLQGVNAESNPPVWSPQLGLGFDLRQINWTQYAGSPLLSPGFNIGGAGSLNLQNAVISVTATGLVLDVPSGRIGTGNPAIVSGGGGAAGVNFGHYFVGEIVQGVNGTDLNGGQYLVDAVNASTGAVTHLTTLVQPSTTTTSLGTAIATLGGSGTGLTITPTAATNNGVSITPTGGPTTIGGSLAVTGTITGPTTTQAVDNNTTALASTAFVLGQASTTTPLINGTAAIGTATTFARANHVHPTDTTRAGLATSPTFTSPVAIGTGTTTQILAVNGPAGVNRTIQFNTASVPRWITGPNGTAEGGANAGSDYAFLARDDAGAALSTPLLITRSNGTVTFGGLAKLAAFTVATLPAAAGNAGAVAYVTDATAPTYRGALTGGGAIKCMVFCDGTAWTSQ